MKGRMSIGLNIENEILYMISVCDERFYFVFCAA